MYKERSSQTGKIMTNSRTKGEVLGETAKTRIKEKLLQDLFNIKKEFWSKETDKGNEQEGESIKLFSKVSGSFGLVKNLEHFENEFFTGTPDVITKDYVIDIKTSWSASTFPFFETEIPTKDYFYQLQAYMDLTGKSKALLVYCLTDASEDQIQDEIRRQGWKDKLIDPTDEQIEALENKVRGQMTFSQVPDQLRVKVFEIDLCNTTLEAMRERVQVAGNYYLKLKKELEKKLIS